MPLDTNAIQPYLRSFQFTKLFTQELGWDNPDMRPQTVQIKEQTYALTPVAHKRGVQVFECSPGANGTIPDYPTRQKIDREARKIAHEHLIIFTDAARSNQTWQWVAREPGKPATYRDHPYNVNQRGDLLIQKLDSIVIPLSDEEDLTLSEVITRTRTAFDKERVTRRFYDRFKIEHGIFLKFIEGVELQADREWYASLMLNRLMFVYFIQRKGFLDDDPDYLPNRLERLKAQHAGDSFFSFYRHFLLKLFHQGLGSHHHTPELEALLGKVPYLNGGLFELHQLEQNNPNIHIPDDAFEKIFDFFDDYQWYLDDRELSNDREINPDVLGYIFEKYINQKQMGAYYTKEDITGYISQNTVIPYLFDAAHPHCRIAFEGDPSIWDYLKMEPDRYIYKPVKKGIEKPLPPEIAAGIADVSKRTGWNRPAPEDYALPTEIWREVVARRKRYEDVWLKLVNGEVRDIKDLITLNLDIRQFAQDVIQNCEGPELLRAFWGAIQSVTVLDPTCGSGAFLFAALNILKPLYEACLNRMQAFVDDLDRSPLPHHPKQFSDFRDTLAHVAAHHNRDYFILKSIILNNLYGVDIMEEAVEICKLRLFLKLVAQVETAEQIEPLPDIDFNIRAGNTLVGFATLKEAEVAIDRKFDFDGVKDRIRERVEIAARQFTMFRHQQTELGGEVTPQDKAALRSSLKKLNDELDRYLAQEYGIDPNSIPDKVSYEDRFQQWRASHQPFHWFVEFYGIMDRGGFDVIIGNPPYIEYIKVREEYTILNYRTVECGNLYAPIIERSFAIARSNARFGMIVQLSSICTDRMALLQSELMKMSRNLWVTNYDDRPAKLFDGLEHIRASIILTQKRGDSSMSSLLAYSTNLIRWYTECRSVLFDLVTYGDVTDAIIPGSIPKIGDHSLKRLIEKVRKVRRTVADVDMHNSSYVIHYHRSPLYWIRSMDFMPIFQSANSNRSVHHFKDFYLREPKYVKPVGSIINSSLFYLWFIVYGNGRNVALRDIEMLPCDVQSLSEEYGMSLNATFATLMDDYRNHSKTRVRKDGVMLQEFYPAMSKHIMDEIDTVLARYYGLTDEELDFIINYDIKYRMGRDRKSEEGERDEE